MCWLLPASALATVCECEEAAPGGAWGKLLGLRLAAAGDRVAQQRAGDPEQQGDPVAFHEPENRGHEEDYAVADDEPAAAPRPRRWIVPPIAWRGAVSYDGRYTSSGEGRTVGHFVTARVGANTYIYQPWFALLSGELGTSFGTTSYPSVLPGDDGATTRSREAFLTGRADFRLFPRSRFPFTGSLEVTDSRTDVALVSYDYRSTRLTLRQAYAPAFAGWNVNGEFDYSTQSVREGGRDTQLALALSYTGGTSAHRLQLSGNVAHNSRTTSDETTLTESLMARHSYSPNPTLNVESTANVAATRQSLVTGSRDEAVAQLMSVGNWRPAGQPYSVSATARANAFRIGNTDTAGAAISAGMNYDFSRQLRLSASASAFGQRSGSQSASGVSESASIAYTPEPMKLGELHYTWSLGTGASHAYSGNTNQLNGSVQATHGLSRSWALGGGFSAASSLNQSVGGVAATGGNSAQVGHAGAMSLSYSGGQSEANLRLQVSDSRALAGDASASTLANLQFSGTLRLGVYGVLTGDLTWQRHWQRSEEALHFTSDTDGSLPVLLKRKNKQSQSSASGSLTYDHNRVFGVPRLRFNSQLRVTDDSVREAEPLAALPDRVTFMWQNRLDYAIGRLTTGLVATWTEVDEHRTYSVMFRVARTFSN